MALQAAGRHSLVDAAIEQLRDQIAAGTWPVDSRIPTEHELAEQLQVGRNTVREAVRVLCHTGMLQARQGEGTFVVSTTDPSALLRGTQRAGMRNVLEVRVALETDAARLAARRHTTEDLDRMRAALEAEQRTLRQGGDVEDAIDHDLRFHQALVESAHNPSLTELYRYFSSSVRSAMVAASGDQEMPPAAPDTHLALIDAVAGGDPDVAETACRTMLDEPVHAVESLLDQH